MLVELEAMLQRLGIVSLRLSVRGSEYVAVARSRGGLTAVTTGVSPDLAVGRVLSVLGVAAT